MKFFTRVNACLLSFVTFLASLVLKANSLVMKPFLKSKPLYDPLWLNKDTSSDVNAVKPNETDSDTEKLTLPKSKENVVKRKRAYTKKKVADQSKTPQKKAATKSKTSKKNK